MADSTVRAGDGDSNTHAYWDNRLVQGKRGIARFQDFVCNILCIFGGADVAEAHNEFIAAHPDERVIVTDAFADGFADFDQCLIADGMAIGVVDLTEVVNINKQKCVDLVRAV